MIGDVPKNNKQVNKEITVLLLKIHGITDNEYECEFIKQSLLKCVQKNVNKHFYLFLDTFFGESFTRQVDHQFECC